MKWKRVSLLAIVWVGCVNVNADMKAWEGHPIGDVIARWGPPAQVLNEGSDHIYVWSKNKSETAPGFTLTNTTMPGINRAGGTANATATTTAVAPTTVTYEATRTFWVTEDGTIYKWSWKGD